jgi:hypothetical protein
LEPNSLLTKKEAVASATASFYIGCINVLDDDGKDLLFSLRDARRARSFCPLS